MKTIIERVKRLKSDLECCQRQLQCVQSRYEQQLDSLKLQFDQEVKLLVGKVDTQVSLNREFEDRCWQEYDRSIS